MRRAFLSLIVLALLGAGVLFGLLGPASDGTERMAGLTGRAEDGRRVFLAAGCGSCHSAPDATGDAKLVLAGGQRFDSPFGTFIAPNISPHPDAGIGNWNAAQLWDALHNGTSPEGQHYFPAFPYGSYTRARPQDVADLHAYLQGLPSSDRLSEPHEVGFPFSIRATLGGWKLLFMSGADIVEVGDNPQLKRGQYLVEALGHCGECHTPRNLLGGLKTGQWLAGAPNPSGKGRIPDIRPSELAWSAEDIAYYLETGFKPDFDSVGGHMAAVVENFGKLPSEDREAVAAYLKALP